MVVMMLKLMVAVMMMVVILVFLFAATAAAHDDDDDICWFHDTRKQNLTHQWSQQFPRLVCRFYLLSIYRPLSLLP